MGIRFRIRRLQSGNRVGFDWFTRSHKGTEGRLLQAGIGEWIGAAAGETGVRAAGGISNSELWIPTACICSTVGGGSGRRAGAAFAARWVGLGRGQRADARCYLLARLRRCPPSPLQSPLNANWSHR